MEKKETPSYICIEYASGQFPRLRSMLTSLTDGEEADPSRHIVLDFSNIDIIYSFEIGILVTTVKKLSGTGRTLFIIINSKIKKVIESTNIERLKNLCMLSENQWNKKRHEIEPVPDIH